MSSSSANQPNRPTPAVPEHELLKRIGGGSFGEVWLARNITTGTHRAVKVVYRDRFEADRAYERELRGVRRFEPVSRTHTGLVDILQVGQNDGEGYFYYVMELADASESVISNQYSVGNPPLSKLAGESTPIQSQTDALNTDLLTTDYQPRTLHSEIQRRGGLPIEECLALGNALADAVAHLHQQGLLHRDIKPANVVFIRGQPKLADIGLVASVAEVGSIVGTRGFIPPEGHVSERSDVFSFGKLLYECAVGKDRLDFPEVPPDAADRPDHAALLELNEVILKACDHDPACRYGSMEELQTDLRLLQQGRSLRRLHRIEGRLKRWTRAAVAVSIVALLALGGWLYQRHQSARFQQLADENRHQLARSHVGQGVRLLDDGDYLASLPWFVEALRLEAGDSARESIHRRRIGAVLRQCPKLVALGTHSKRIFYAEFSRDGRRIVTASADGTARVWDAETSEPVTAPLRHEGDVGMAVFSPDGTKVTTCSDDWTARVWDAATGQPLTEPLRHQSNVIHIAFSEDSRRVLTGSHDRMARLWDAATGRPIGNALVHEHTVYMVTFSPDGRWMATTSNDRTARVWNASNAEPVSPPLTHPKQVTHAAFSPDGRWLATTCRDHAVRLWDTRTWQPTTLPVKHSGVARQVAFSPDGSKLASTGGETGPDNRAQNSGEVMLWQVSSGELLLPPMRHAESVHEVFFTPDGRWLLSASSDATARLWDTETGASLGPIFRQGASVRNAALSLDGRRVLTSGLDGVWRVWDLAGMLAAQHNVAYLNHLDAHAEFSADGHRVLTRSAADAATVWAVPVDAAARTFFQVAHSIGHAVFSADGRLLAVSHTNGLVRVLDASTGELVSPPMPHEEVVGQLTFNRDGRWLATIGVGRTVRIWEARTGRAITALLEHRYPPLDAAFSPDGLLLAIGCGDSLGIRKGEVRVWSVATGQPAIPPFAVEGAAIQVAFSPDSRHLVTACGDSTADPRSVSIVDVTAGGRIVRSLPHPDGVSSVAYSPDGRRIVTGCTDGRARIWDSVSGQPLAQTLPHLRGIRTVTFNQDASLLATASLDGTARVWEVATGTPVSPWLKHDGHVLSVEFNADGNRLLSASGSGRGLGRASLWDLAPTDKHTAELERVAKVLSGCELDAALNLTPLGAEALKANRRQLRSDWPEITLTSADTAIAWHEAHAAECERQRQWFAARFHLERLNHLKPEKGEFIDRRQRAEAALRSSFSKIEGKASSRPRTAGE